MERPLPPATAAFAFDARGAFYNACRRTDEVRRACAIGGVQGEVDSDGIVGFSAE